VAVARGGIVTITLEPLFDRPLHPRNYARPPKSQPGWDHYAITGQFADKDALPANQGQQHRAVDCGDKQGRPAPLLAPFTCRYRGLFHWDGAIGIEGQLAPLLSVIVWHLSKTISGKPIPGVLARGPWVEAKAGQQIGMTGNTGVQPMPFHSHIELWSDGARIDPEPHLVVVGRATKPIEVPSDMRLVHGRARTVGDIGPGNRLRVEPKTTDGSISSNDVIEPGKESVEVQVLQTDTRGQPWSLFGKEGDRYTTVALASGDVYYVADPLVTNIRLKGRGLSIPTITPDDLRNAYFDGRAAMRVEAIQTATALKP